MRIRKFLFTHLELLPILFLSLAPLLWYRSPNSLALGHDMGFPIEPKSHFVDRLFTWTERLGLGADQQISVGAFFIHGLEAFLSNLGLSIFTVQKAVFIFWVIAPALAFYFLLKTVFEKKEYWPMRVFGILFYAINHFFLQAWSIAERTKFSMAVALPLSLAFYIKYQQGKLSMLTASFLIALSFFFFNGGGTPPLLGPAILAFLVAGVFFVFWDKESKLSSLARQIKFLLVLLVVFVVLNAYWVFPLANLYANSYNQGLQAAGGIDGIINWVNAISANANIVNLIRLQGIPDWYDNVNHSYASVFLENKFLVLTSYAFPLMAFSAPLLAKKRERRRILLFGFFAFAALVFAGGSKGPLGGSYNHFVRLIPGFAVFRTPIYKFGLLLWLSYAVLVSFSLNKIYNRLPSLLGVGLISVVFFAYLFYNFPYFSGTFFDYLAEPYSTRIELPSYVLKLHDSLEKLGDGKILVLPPQEKDLKADRYNWGYWSTTSIPSIVSRSQSILSSSAKTENEELLLGKIYKAIGEEDWEEFSFLSRLVSVRYLIVRLDFIADEFGQTAQEIDTTLAKNSSLFELKESTGQWKIYEYSNYRGGSQYFDEDLATFVNEESVESISDLSHLTEGPIIQLPSEGTVSVKDDARVIVTADCLSCDKERVLSKRSDPGEIWAGSVFYGFVEKAEEDRLEKSKDDFERLTLAMEHSLKQLKALKSSLFVNRDEPGKSERILQEHRERLLLTQEIIDNLSTPEKQKDIEHLDMAYLFLISEKEFAYELSEEIADKSGLFALLQGNIAMLSQAERGLSPWIWDYDKNRMRFALETPIEGVYRMVMNGSEFDEYFDEEEEVKLYVDGREVETQKEILSGNLVELGRRGFSKGVHTIEIEGIRNRNLLTEADSSFTVSSDAGRESCHVFQIPELDPKSTYQISFDHQNESGASLWFFTTSDADRASRFLPTYVINRKFQRNNRDRAHSVFSFFPNEAATRASINFCSLPNGVSQSINRVFDLEVTKLISPAVIAEYMDHGRADSADNRQVSLRKINQTKYEGEMAAGSGGYLTLEQRFSPLWQARIYNRDGTKETVDEGNHLVYNGYANAWKLPDGAQQRTVVVEYSPQRVYLTGWVVSATSVIAGLSLLIWKKL